MTARLGWTRSLVAALTLLGAGLAAAYDLPRLPGELALKRGADSPGQVTFRHQSHVDSAKPTCLACHPERFSLLGRSATEKRPAITHQRMTAGRDCGACHGKEAFGLDDCTMCHAD
jgi:c(7)-type cytochrome triheme protein